ncbi:hypothetical protein BAY61_31450 [Prauserella marina]|uniref:Uncharacterized protein n=1 Tax=Prauserella marina TaxID=530584 RepID=A0A222VXW3_9PSEU|nr:hypothetical protein [Prauserella marina]ASR38768.1 hypothetical protein BAY61_31450 [Prauserella marina]PWV82126.1 hypothetical protein DES30_102362 [Prauserella marina]SDD19926.1 hypothetical protein SAMN05421630_106362 [Prauserella marina]
MGSGFRPHGRRFGTAGVLVAVSALSVQLLAPGVASAAEPVVVGSCSRTLNGDDGKPLTLDIGSAVNAPGLLDVGLGADSGALLSLPVKETLKGLGISETGPVVDTAGRLCDTVTDLANRAAAPVQRAIPEPNPVVPPRPEKPAPEEPPSEEPPPEPEEPAPGAPGQEPAPPPPEVPPSTLPVPSERFAGIVPIGDFSTLGPISVPPAVSIPPFTPPAVPDLGGPDANRAPDTVKHGNNPGTARALSLPDAPDRLPMLLAVLALVLVVAALARTWVRRRSA